jgi:hypothetical protein
MAVQPVPVCGLHPRSYWGGGGQARTRAIRAEDALGRVTKTGRQTLPTAAFELSLGVRIAQAMEGGGSGYCIQRVASTQSAR